MNIKKLPDYIVYSSLGIGLIGLSNYNILIENYKSLTPIVIGILALSITLIIFLYTKLDKKLIIINRNIGIKKRKEIANAYVSLRKTKRIGSDYFKKIFESLYDLEGLEKSLNDLKIKIFVLAFISIIYLLTTMTLSASYAYIPVLLFLIDIIYLWNTILTIFAVMN